MLEIVPEIIFGAVMIWLILQCTKGLVDGLKRFVDNHKAYLLDTPQQLAELFGLKYRPDISSDWRKYYWHPGFNIDDSATHDLSVWIYDDGFTINFMRSHDAMFTVSYSTEAWSALRPATRRAVLRDIAVAYRHYRQQIDESLREAFLS